MKTKTIIKSALAFFIPLIVGLIVFPMFFGLQLTTNAVLLIMAFAGFISLVSFAYKKVGHQGQIPIWIGLTLIFGSLLAILSSIGIQGSEKLIELESRSQGFSLIGLAIGVMFLISGLKAMNQFSYGLGNIKSK